MKAALGLSVILMCLLLSATSCRSSTAPAEITSETDPLLSMLRAIPQSEEWSFACDNLMRLSEYEGVDIPSRKASLEEKMEWYTAIQDNMVAGLSMPVADFWGFDFTDIHSQLWQFGESSLRIITGDMDTEGLAEKLRGYNYSESEYRNIPIFAGTPDESNDLSVQRFLPRAFAIIEHDESAVLIIMAGDGDLGVTASEAEAIVKASIDAYMDDESLADGRDLTEMVTLLGQTGAAYFSDAVSFEQRVDRLSDEIAATGDNIGSYVGPGHLTPYSAYAIAYRKENNSDILEFVLAYNEAATARHNLPVVEQRLGGGRSLMHSTPLTGYNRVREVTADGRLLRVTIELISEARQNPLFLKDIIWMSDYLFLAPGEYGD